MANSLMNSTFLLNVGVAFIAIGIVLLAWLLWPRSTRQQPSQEEKFAKESPTNPELSQSQDESQADWMTAEEPEEEDGFFTNAALNERSIFSAEPKMSLEPPAEEPPAEEVVAEDEFAVEADEVELEAEPDVHEPVAPSELAYDAMLVQEEQEYLQNADGREDNLEYDFMDTKDAIPVKLDLARAYLEMGDYEAVKDTLGLVLEQGSKAQQREAELLLEQARLAQGD